MSVCVFIAADCPLPEFKPSQEYPLYINLDTKTVYDGGADDNYFLIPIYDVDIYCRKKYGVELQLIQYTEGRAKQIINYIKNALSESNSVEFWKVWLLGYWEFEDRPYIHKKTVRIDELIPNDIKDIYDAENWNNKDKDRPSFYCLEIIS